MRRFLTAAVALLFMATTAFAWSTKEHILVTRLAAARLLTDPATPEAMKQWLRDAVPGDLSEPALREFFLHGRQGIFPRGVDGLSFWAVVPDLEASAMRSNETVAPFGVHERLLHYLDVEFFDPQQQNLPENTKPQYKPDLSAAPRLADVPRDMADRRFRDAGMLPFRVEQAYQRTVEHIRDGRLNDKPGQFPRDEHATRWAGLLAHYIADNTQPHHASVDYKSRTYFPDPARAPDVHAQMEYKLVDDEHADYPEMRDRLWALLLRKLEQVDDPVTTADVWEGSVQTSLRSYDALPLIGQAALAAWQKDAPGDRPWEQGIIDTEAFFAYEGDWRGRKMSVAEMKAEQLALAVHRIAAHWRQAWKEATGE